MTEKKQPFSLKLTNFFQIKKEEDVSEEEHKSEEEEDKSEEEEMKSEEEEMKSEEEDKSEEEEMKSDFGFCEDKKTKKKNKEGSNCKEYLFTNFIGLFTP